MSTEKKHNALLAVFHHIFYRKTDEDWEESINPRIGHGTDFLLTAHVFRMIQKKFNIDFWEWYHIQPHYHYHLRDDPNPCVIVCDGKETIEPNYRKGERYELSPRSIALQEKWYREDTQNYGRNPTFEMMFKSVKKDEWWHLESCIDPNTWTLGAIEWQIQFLNIIFQTDYSTDNVYSFSGEYEEELEKVWYDNINSSDSIAYFDMMNYLITWIDRWAHDLVDPSKIPESEKTNIYEYGGIKGYDDENDLPDRSKLLTSECSRPDCLNVVWELFLMCEDEILNNESFEVDESNVVKIKKK